MAIVVANRKRGVECSPNLQASKERRFSDKPVFSSNAPISRHSRSPAAKISLRREFHSRCRGFLRFGLLFRASVLKRKTKPRDWFGNKEISRETKFGRKYATKKDTSSFHPLVDSIYEDSSIDLENLVEEHSSLHLQSRPFMEKHVQALKKHRFLDKPVSSSDATISRLCRYSARKVSLRRKFHASCRGSLRFRLLVRASVLKRKAKPRDCSGNEGISRETVQVWISREDDMVKLVEEHTSSLGVWNGENENNLRVSLLSQSLPLMEKPVQLKVFHEPFLPLKEEEEAEVKSAFSVENRMKVLVSHKNSNIDIRGETLQCLSSAAWLNDEVINIYLGLLKERETRDPQKYFKCHFFNTFFYIKLVSSSGYNYEAVRRWTTQRKLGYNLIDCDIIFVPIHGGVHWTLAVINIKERKFMYLDSLTGVNPMVLNALAKYLVDEVKDKSGKDIDVSSWDMEYVKDLPRQHNGYDCGMFMLKYIDFYSRGLNLHFSQKDMTYFRLRTAMEILRLRAN